MDQTRTAAASARDAIAADAQPGGIQLGRCLSNDLDIGHWAFQLMTPGHVRWEAGRSETMAAATRP